MNDNSNESRFQFCHLNVNSLLAGVNTNLHIPSQHSKLDEIYSSLVIEHKFDVIALTETWLDANINSEDIKMENFQIFRKDRNRHGGGVMVYVLNSLSCIRRFDLEVGNTEMLWIQLNLNNKRVMMCVCYRPPGQCAAKIQDFLTDLQTSIDLAISTLSDSIIITGDLNDRCIMWDDDRPVSELNTQLRDLVLLNNMYQIITEPTHYTDHSAYLLDIIITDSPGFIEQSGLLPHIGNLHHLPIFARFKYTYMSRRSFTRDVWHYHNGNYVNLNAELSEFDWSELITEYDVSSCTTELFDVFLNITKKHIPYRTIRVRPKDKPWMNPYIKHLIRLRNRWTGRYNLTRLNNHKLMRDHYRASVKYEICFAKSLYYNRQMTMLQDPNLHIKKYWSIVRSVCGNKIKGPIPTIIDGDVTYNTDIEKAELFSDYFASQSILPPPPSDYTLPEFHYLTDARLTNIEFQPEEIRSVISKLNSNKACGPDGIGNHLLKLTAESMATPFANLFSRSLQEATFPNSWKDANLSPVQKSSFANEKTNFRPISLLACPSKVMERIVFNTMYEYFIANDLLIKENSGFKKNDSTINQLVHIVHNIYKGLDDKKDVCMVFLDISKAFDRVYHEGLIFKLKQLGIEGNLLNWIRSYLTNRTQTVVLNGYKSERKIINAGVPQGSILGPLLFLVYINDIISDISSNIYLFADDTSIFRVIDDINTDFRMLNSDLQKLSNWSSQWRMTFNANKTKFIYFSLKHKRPPLPQLLLDGTPIAETDHHTHLGLTLNNKMTWNDHIDRICTKVAKTLNSFKRIKHIVPRSTLQSLYKCLIRPVLDYGDIIFDNMTLECSKRLDDIQREAALICTGAMRRTNTLLLLHEVGWEPLETRRKNHKLILYFKMINDLSPSYLSTLIPNLVNHTSRYNLRNSNSLRIPYARTARLYKYFTVSTARLWNDLPDSIKNSNTLNQFKTALKRQHGFKSNMLYLISHTTAQVSHTRMRLGLSSLSKHLYNYHIIEDSTCQFCNMAPEDTSHYILHCPYFTFQRMQLLSEITEVIPFDLLQTLSERDLISGFMFGFEGMDMHVNVNVFMLVQKFIQESDRF